jgi:hypothetical protein
MFKADATHNSGNKSPESGCPLGYIVFLEQYLEEIPD